MNLLLKKDHNNIIYSGKKIVYLPYRLIRNQQVNISESKDFFNLCSFFKTFLIDRTRTLNTNIKIFDSIPFYLDSDYTFDEVCKISAKRIVAEALTQNKQIELLWSGGIDSTTALIAIYKELKISNKSEYLKIILSQESINEFKKFFISFIKPNINYTIFTPPIFTSMNPKNLTITGELGDQLFGGNTAYSYLTRDDIFESYKESFSSILYETFRNQKTVNNILTFSEPLIQKAPFQLKSLYDVLWWFDFVGKWQFVQFNLISKTYQEGILKFKINDNIVHFFNHIEFQKWAIQNRKNQTQYTPYTYKLQAKEYIYNFFPDETYLLKKQKEKSLKKIISSNQFPFKK